MTYSDEEIMAYADGELDAARRAEIEAAIARDVELQRRIQTYRTQRSAIDSAFSPILSEPVPSRILAAARTRRSAPRQRDWREWGALAASFLLGAVVWRFGANSFGSNSITERNGGLVASGALARALSDQLASTQDPQSAAQVGLSFESKSGAYCRTFTLRQREAVAGLACRRDDVWELPVLAKTEVSREPTAGLRPAASPLPPAVLETANAMIRGEPLDAHAEAAARAAHWRAVPGQPVHSHPE